MKRSKLNPSAASQNMAISFNESLNKLLAESSYVLEYVIIDSSIESKLVLGCYLVLAKPITTKLLYQQIKQNFATEVPEFIIIPVTHIPYDKQGNVDYRQLQAISVLNDTKLKDIEQQIIQLPNVKRAAVVMQAVPLVRRSHLHLTDLIPPQFMADIDNKQLIEPINTHLITNHTLAADEKILAITHGGELIIPSSAPTTLTMALLKTAATYPTKNILYVDEQGHRTVQTYGDLLIESKQILAGLLKHGYKPGMPAILHIAQAHRHFAAFWGCVLAGIVPVTVNSASDYSEKNAVTDKFYNVYKLLGQPLVIADESNIDKVKELNQLYSLATFSLHTVEELSSEQACDLIHVPNPSDVIFYQLTSGSTGTPKCIQLTHKGIIAHIHGSSQYLNYDASDICLNWLPYDHVVPTLTYHLKNTYLGCKQIEVKTNYILANPTRWLDLIEEYQVTHSWSPNFGYKLVAEAIRKANNRQWQLSSIKYLMNAGEQVTASVLREFIECLQNSGIKEEMLQPAFGMAEACTCMTYQRNFTLAKEVHWIDKDSYRVGFIGLGAPIPGVSVRITNDDNSVVPEGVIGNMQIKGTVITPGYLHNSIANLEAFTEDDWFNSGDLGFIAQGKLTLTGRQKETIIINGANYYCYEIEDAVNTLPGVLPTYVAATSLLKESIGTELLAIFFVADNDKDIPVFDIYLSIKNHIAKNVGLNAAFVIPVNKEQFFKTTSGKIQRAQFKKLLQIGHYDAQIKQLDILASNENTLPDWFYLSAWVKRKINFTIENKCVDNVLLFDDGSSTGISNRFKQDLANSKGHLYVVKKGTNFHFDPKNHTVTINPKFPRHYQRLLDHLSDNNIVICTIIYCWSYQSTISASLDSYEEFSESFDNYFFDFVYLIQALIAQNKKQQIVNLLFLANYTQTVLAKDKLDIAKAPIIAVIKALMSEVGWLKIRSIDIGDYSADSLLLLNEFTMPDFQFEIAYRNNSRWVKLLKPVEFNKINKQPIPFEQNGMYLISGGLGDIGFEIANFLLTYYQAKLLIIGNTKLVSDVSEDSAVDSKMATRIARLEELQKKGVVEYAATDIGDEILVDKIITTAEKSWGTSLHGVIHLAGAYHECFVSQETKINIQHLFYPKVTGAIVLHKLLAKRCPNGLFIHFSSTIGTFSGAGLAIYAAANRFLDDFASYQRKCGLNSFSVAWSNWYDKGLSKGYQHMDVQQAKGFEALHPMAAIKSLLAVLQTSFAHILVGINDTRPFIYQQLVNNLRVLQQPVLYIQPVAKSQVHVLKAAMQNFNFKDLVGNQVNYTIRWSDDIPLINGKIDYAKLSLGEHEQESTVQPKTVVEKQIAKIWQSVLGIDNISTRKSFFELGGNSLLMAKLQTEINSGLNVNISTVELFKYTTVDKQATYVDTLIHPQIAKKSLTVIGSQAPETLFEDIAVIGMAGYFPGAEDLTAFWQNLKNSVESIQFFSDESLSKQGIADELLTSPNYVKAGAVLDKVTHFDADFFGYSAREAILLDPQQRIFLECVWHALENAGYDPQNCGKRVGIFAGSLLSTYLLDNVQKGRCRFDLDMARFLETLIANDKDFIASRAAYKLNLQGPAVTVQSACSTALVAIHQACKSLLLSECEICLAGAVAIRFPHYQGYMYEEGSIVAPDGHCRPFSAEAQGTVFGNGVGVVVLKRLSAAVRDNDNIIAVIKSTAINNDGMDKISYTAPSINGQIAVCHSALNAAQINPETVTFIEAHGTGTALGDPIEVAALEQVYNTGNQKQGSCILGSVKSNIGHLDSAAGMAGFIKTLLCLQHRQIPATLHYNKPNLKINFADSIFKVNNQLIEWTTLHGNKRRAAVNSLGVGGTNAHAILEEFIPAHNRPVISIGTYLIVLSAKTEPSLVHQTKSLIDFLTKNPTVSLADLAYTYQIGRSQFSYRKAVICKNVSEAISSLEKDCSELFSNTSKEELSECIPFDLLADPSHQQLVELAKIWMNGHSVAWSNYYPHHKPYKIALPGYAFQRKLYSFAEKEIALTPNDNMNRSTSLPIYQINWDVAETLLDQNSDEGNALNGKWIIFDDGAIGAQLAANISKEGGQSYHIYPGNDYLKIGADHYILNPSFADHFQRLCEELILKSGNRIERIVYLWPLIQYDETINSFDLLKRITSLLYLIQSLARYEHQTMAKVIIVTQGAQSILNNDLTIKEQLYQSPYLGFARVIATEHKQLFGALIDVDAKNSDSTVALLYKAISTLRYQELAIRENRYYLPKVSELGIKLPQAPSLALSSQATYLITGGFGSLGKIFANWLIKQGAKNIVLIGRSVITEISAQLEQNYPDVKVLALAIDVSEPDKLQQLLAKINTEMPPLRGIVHAAGMIDDKLLVNQSAESIKNVFAAKINGSWNLHQLTLDYQLDFFILFSSISSLIGLEGQANYAAGNAFLDALGKYRQHLNLPCQVISWGPWETGMANNKSLSWPAGIGLLTTDTSLDLFQQFFDHKLQHGICANVDWQQYLNSIVRHGLNCLLNEPTSSEYQQITKIIHTKHDLMITLKKTLAQILAIDDLNSIDNDIGFDNLGLNSLLAIKFKAELEKELIIKLPSTLAYDYPTLTKLFEYLQSQFSLKKQDNNANDSDLLEPDDWLSQLNYLESLTEEQAEELLQKSYQE